MEKKLINNSLEFCKSMGILNSFRPGSEMFFIMCNEARKNLDGFSEEDVEILSTDIGEFADFEGQEVPLDYPMLVPDDVQKAEYQGREVELNKPKRGGGKKFYVYVKNPDTGNVIRVEFGAKDGGQNLAVKLRDPEARRNFAARHNCSEKKDKTTPGYWSCALPRYWGIITGDPSNKINARYW